ncbi:MAG: GDP-mannose 4,6-dehydratase, partial [Pseudomonadota bacterium]
KAEPHEFERRLMEKVGLAGKHVLVAGGAGFVGSALLRILLSSGALVWSFDDYSTGSEEHLPDHPNLIRVEGDACEEESVRALFSKAGFHQVYHCIGDTFVPEAYDFPHRFFARNVGTTLNLLKAAEDSRSLERMLYVSSTEVYGEISQEHADEGCELRPVNTYAVSKLAADRLCYTYFLEHGVPVITARIFNCYGPRATHEYVIPEIIRQLHESSTLRLGNVDAERDFTYVDDTAKGLIALSNSALPHGDVANIGSSKATSVRDLAMRIAGIMGLEDVHIEQDAGRLRRHDIVRFCADSSKLRNATGWSPDIGLDEGLRRTIDWYQENGRRWTWMSRA